MEDRAKRSDNDLGPAEISPHQFVGSSSQAAIVDMIAAEREALAAAIERFGEMSHAAATHSSILRLLLAQARGQNVGGVGLGSPIEVAATLADVFRFEVPRSHRRHLGSVVTRTKQAVMFGFKPFHVETLRPQAEFNRALVEVLQQLLSAQALGNRDWIRQRLSKLADAMNWQVKSHRSNVGGQVVELTKRTYLGIFSRFLRKPLESQRQWNEAVIKLLELWRRPDVPSDTIVSILDRLAHLSDPLSEPGTSHDQFFVWRELLRRQVQFNQHIVSMLRGAAGYERVENWSYAEWVQRRESLRMNAVSEALRSRPTTALITVLCKVEAGDDIAATVSSLRSQVYENWRLELLVEGDLGDEGNRRLNTAVSSDSRVARAAIDQARVDGEWIAFVEAGDQLAPHALGELLTRLQTDPELELVYSDEDRVDNSVRATPFLKPDWTYELLTSADYMSRLLFVRRSLFHTIGGIDWSNGPAASFDLVLRAVEHSARIGHISEVLYSRSRGKTGVVDFTPPGAVEALKRHFARRAIDARITLRSGALTTRYAVKDKPLVSIIVPFRDKPELLRQLLSSLKLTKYENYEVLLISNNSVLDETRELLESLNDPKLVKLEWNHPFNYPAINNFGAIEARGELLLFLNNDIEIVEPEWLDVLVGHLQQPGVEAVGPKLLFPDGRIQHAGVVVGMGGFAGHVFAGQEDDGRWSPFGSANWARNYLALTSACVLLRRTTFESLHGFDERFQVCGSDVDICLRVVQQGKRVVYTPATKLIHHESATRRNDRIPAHDYWESFRSYRSYLNRDPFYSPHLSLAVTEPKPRQEHEPAAIEVAIQVLDALESVGGAGNVSGGRLAYSRTVQGMAQMLDLEASDFKPAPIRPLAGRPRRLTWLLPYFNHPFGGIHTLLRFADAWKRKFGVENHFIIYDNPHVTSREIVTRVAKLYPQPPGSFEVLKSTADLERMPEADVVISTLWTSAYFATKHPRARYRAYFVQDYEPLFYPAGSMSALCENSYNLGFYGIFNTQGLHDFVVKNHSMQGVWFEPSVDHDLFHARNRVYSEKGPVRIFFYGRPSTDRNAFELGLEALRKVKNVFGSDVAIYSAGEAWNPAWYGVEHVIENLGVLPYHETAKLYRTTDIGLCFMFTKHPSYLPLEMMASGVAVVTNENAANGWLLQHMENSCLVKPTVSSVAESLVELVESRRLREKLGRVAAQRMLATDWDDEAVKVYDALASHCMALDGKHSVTG